MLRYKFARPIYKSTDGKIEQIGTTDIIMYKCLICGHTKDWDDNWDDVKKTEVKEETEKHHNDHLVSQN
jgi:hypothetical protein